MKLSAIYKYQLAEHRNSFLIFYAVIAAILAVVFGINALTGLTGIQYEVPIQVSGIDLAPAVFLFVCGLNAFKGNFKMALQNGISRKSLFINRIFVILTLSTGMALINQIVSLVGKLLASLSGTIVYESILEELYAQRYAGHSNEAWMYLESFLFYLAVFIVCFSIGYLITTVFYQMNKKQKISYIVGFYIIVFVILPLANTLLYHSGIISVQISEVLLRFLDIIMGVSAQNPYIGIFSLLILSILINGSSWLLIRKAGVKN
ncbi:hypothetical protein [Acetobacterium bakii]|uniref:Uncharacterized protein n=1 Tax=Acetobacterium bakii TaxID=52689 RepID=A0A0L6U406_9FIRM|nr:hypothetical protein [Acetobacterium bakii]KNZ43243.1 hypothetical protein AKG39_02030 [Acetobacterium bakii]